MVVLSHCEGISFFCGHPHKHNAVPGSRDHSESFVAATRSGGFMQAEWFPHLAVSPKR
jgi:hypothetical protein